jgi:hypothetical protein
MECICVKEGYGVLVLGVAGPSHGLGPPKSRQLPLEVEADGAGDRARSNVMRQPALPC